LNRWLCASDAEGAGLRPVIGPNSVPASDLITCSPRVEKKSKCNPPCCPTRSSDSAIASTVNLQSHASPDFCDDTPETIPSDPYQPRRDQFVTMGDEFEFEDDVFDDFDEHYLAELERSSQQQPDLLGLAERILKANFGYEAFRHEQAGVIQSLMAGHNALAVFPTGAGKSLCYQVGFLQP